jgi:hypothetical protein
MPVLGNIQPAAEPDALMLLHIVEKLRQGGHPSWATDQATVEPNRHHLGRRIAFGTKGGVRLHHHINQNTVTSESQTATHR